MILTYYFNEDDDAYYYDADDLFDFMESLKPIEVVDFANYVYNGLTENDKQELNQDLEVNVEGVLETTTPDTFTMQCADAVLEYAEMDDYREYFDEKLLDFYRQDAYEQYEDSKAYNEDPLGYNGMSQSDFI